MKLGILGHPLAHSLSPELHGYLMAASGITGEYLKYDTRPEELERTLDRLRETGILGFNVTIPFKRRIIPYLSRLSDEARSVGAVNTVSCVEGELRGFNTDIQGVLRTFSCRKIASSSRKVVILGAGGAARAVLFAVLQSGAKEVVIANRTIERARKMIREMESLSAGASITLRKLETGRFRGEVDEKTLVIQCTPIGAWPNVDAAPVEFVGDMSGAVVFDLIYNPLETKFLRRARAAGARAIDGLDMLIFQGIAAQNIWLERTLAFDHGEAREKMISIQERHAKN